MKSLYDPLHATLDNALYSQSFKQMNLDPFLELKTYTYWAIRPQLRREMFNEMQEQIRER